MYCGNLNACKWGVICSLSLKTKYLGRELSGWNPSLMTTYLTGKAKNNGIDIKVLLGQMYRTEIPRKKKKKGERKYASTWETLGCSLTKKSKYLLGNIFTASYCCVGKSTLCISLSKADLVHECASCCQWVTWKICHLVRVSRKGAIAVYTVQDYCNAIIWANGSKCCAWGCGLLHCTLVISIAYLSAGCMFTKAYESGLCYLQC